VWFGRYNRKMDEEEVRKQLSAMRKALSDLGAKLNADCGVSDCDYHTDDERHRDFIDLFDELMAPHCRF
jgi:hypothetical protein